MPPGTGTPIDRQIGRLAGGLRPGGGGGERREQAQSEAEAGHLHRVRPSLYGPPARPCGRAPGLACCSWARSTILSPARTRRGFAAAPGARARPSGGPGMQTSPRFRPFETALDEGHALAVLREATAGADDGELFLERRRGESLVFDDGRLKNASYDAAEGFGLRAVRGETAGYAHSTEISEAALTRAAETARLAVGAGGGNARGGAAADQPAALHRPRPVRRRRVRGEGRDAARDRRLRPRPRPARRAGVGEPRRLDAGGRDPAPRGHAARRGPADGAAQRLGHRRGERPARIGLGRRRRPHRPRRR